MPPLTVDEQWESFRSIFDKRGVSRDIAEARRYVPYVRGAEWVAADDGPFAVIPPEQRRTTIARDARGADGLVMMKHPVPLKGRKLADFPPQLRPTPMQLADATESIRVHDHTDHWLTARGSHVTDRHGGVDVEGLHDNYIPELHRHGDREHPTASARAEHVAGKQHHGVDTNEEHEKDTEGKYKLPATPLTDVREPHHHPRPVRREFTDKRGVFGESPLASVRRTEPNIGYRGVNIATASEDGGPLELVSGRDAPNRVLQDTVEWQIAEGYRWRGRSPRRMLGEVVEHRDTVPLAS